MGGDSSPVVKSNAWPGLSRGEVIPRDELYAKIERSEVFSSWGKDCPNIQMLNAQLLNDAWRERIVIVNAHTHTHLICVYVSQGFTLNISKGQERKQREKWISESGAVVPEEIPKRPPSPGYNRNKIV